MRISAAVDIACWDIIGKVAGLPLYRLFGGYRSEVPCYVTCAYYRDGKTLSELRDEMQMLKAQGHTGFKAKAGGAPLAEDLERMALVREIIGDDRDLMIDVNRGWDLATAIEGARLLEPLAPALARGAGALGRRPAGAEAPRAEDAHPAVGRRERAHELRLPRAARGAGDPDPAVRLHDDGRLHRGPEARRAVRAEPACRSRRTTTASSTPTSSPAVPPGCIVESFTDPERDPLQAELFEDPPKIANGRLKLKEQPGLGLTLSTAALKKFGERIL